MSNVEEFSPELMVRWECNQRIVVYSIQAVTPQLTEKWEGAVLGVLEQWATANPYLALHDLSEEGIALPLAIKVRFDLMNLGITPQGLKQAVALFAQQPDFRAYIAIVLNQSTSGYMGQIYTTDRADKIPQVLYRLFFDYATALEWLQGMCGDGQHDP